MSKGHLCFVVFTTGKWETQVVKDYKAVQNIVGGDLEIVPGTLHDFVPHPFLKQRLTAYVDEEGALKEENGRNCLGELLLMALNDNPTFFMCMPTLGLRGNMVFEACKASGDAMSLSKKVLAMLDAGCKALSVEEMPEENDMERNKRVRAAMLAV